MRRTKYLFYSMSVFAMTPFVVGCDPITSTVAVGGGILWLDIFLIPVRAFLGSAALDLVNTI